MSLRELEKLFVEPDEPRHRSEDSIHFDTLAHAARALEETTFSTFESRAAEAGIFARLDAQQSTTQEPEDLEVVLKSPAVNSNRRRLFAVFAAVAVALVMIPFIPTDDRETSEWQARSAQPFPTKEVPKIHVFCVRQEGESLAFVGQNESPFGVITCEPTDDLKIAYENTDPSLKFAHFVGLSDGGESLWYGPTPIDPPPFSVRITDEPTPLGETRRLAVNHSAGRYRVLGLFTQRALTFPEFEAMVERLKISDDQSGLDPGVVLVQAEFEVKP